MYGDPQQIRAVAARLRHLADEVGDERAVLARGQDVEWHSVAADAFRRELSQWQGDVARSVDEIREAAAAVDRHADEVEERIEAIRAAEAWARQEIAELRDTASGALDRVGAAVRGAFDDAVSFARERLGAVPDVLPDPGDVGWLSVRDRLGGGK